MINGIHQSISTLFLQDIISHNICYKLPRLSYDLQTQIVRSNTHKHKRGSTLPVCLPILQLIWFGRDQLLPKSRKKKEEKKKNSENFREHKDRCLPASLHSFELRLEAGRGLLVLFPVLERALLILSPRHLVDLNRAKLQ